MADETEDGVIVEAEIGFFDHASLEAKLMIRFGESSFQGFVNCVGSLWGAEYIKRVLWTLGSQGHSGENLTWSCLVGMPIRVKREAHSVLITAIGNVPKPGDKQMWFEPSTDLAALCRVSDKAHLDAMAERLLLFHQNG